MNDIAQWTVPQNRYILPFLYFPYVHTIKFITNRKYAFFCINFVRLSTNNHKAYPLDSIWPSTVLMIKISSCGTANCPPYNRICSKTKGGSFKLFDYFIGFLICICYNFNLKLLITRHYRKYLVVLPIFSFLKSIHIRNAKLSTSYRLLK